MIYLDNAATTYPKPPQVIQSVSDCMRFCGGNPGRGAHPLAMAASDVVFDCRNKLSDFFGAAGAEKVVLTNNTTFALNIAIKGISPFRRCEAMHFVISDLEHNSVFRPIARLCREGKADYSVFSTGAGKNNGRVDTGEILNNIEHLICRRTVAVVSTAASNVCSVALPIAEIGELCRRRGILFIVDGAQGAGHSKIDVGEFGISALAVPGHKGLYGPQGSGALILGDYMPQPLVEGGSGSASFESAMPDEPPERYEAGTLNVPSAAGLSEGIDFVSSIGTQKIKQHHEMLFDHTVYALEHIRGVTVYAKEARGTVVGFNLKGASADSVAGKLAEAGICTRGGYHCSPLAHKTLGTSGMGSVRVSFGCFTDKSDIDIFAEVLSEIAQKLR